MQNPIIYLRGPGSRAREISFRHLSGSYDPHEHAHGSGQRIVCTRVAYVVRVTLRRGSQCSLAIAQNTYIIALLAFDYESICINE